MVKHTASVARSGLVLALLTLADGARPLPASSSALPGARGIGVADPASIVESMRLHFISSPATHTVEPGETFWSIARKYGVDFQKLADLNHQEAEYTIRIGDQLRLPPSALTGTGTGTGQGPADDPAEAIRDEGGSPATRHQVQTGETLYRIAKNYGVSLEALVQANQIEDPTTLRAGEALIIPGSSSTAAASSKATTSPPTASRPSQAVPAPAPEKLAAEPPASPAPSPPARVIPGPRSPLSQKRIVSRDEFSPPNPGRVIPQPASATLHTRAAPTRATVPAARLIPPRPASKTVLITHFA